MGDVICNYKQHSATIVSDRVTILEANKHLNLVGGGRVVEYLI